LLDVFLGASAMEGSTLREAWEDSNGTRARSEKVTQQLGAAQSRQKKKGDPMVRMFSLGAEWDCCGKG